MSSIQYQELDFNFLYKIEGFRYLSNINGLSLLDGTYLERLITARSFALSKIACQPAAI